MTLRQKINQAIDTSDAVLAGRIVERLRNGYLTLKDGTPVLFAYNDCVEWFQKERPNFSREDFEDLMIRADDAEAAQ